MTPRQSTIDTGMGVSCIASTVVHLAVFLLLVWWGKLFPVTMKLQETYYVDVVNLPVATPQAGDSAQKPGDVDSGPTSPASVPPQSMVTPKNTNKNEKQKTAQKINETESAFNERMAKLEGTAEARQYEEKINRLTNSNNTANSAKAGARTAAGTEAGSSYAAYIQSRLEDALKVTSFYTTNKPEVVVRLYISSDGRLSRMKIERSSGDAAFLLSVRRAIELASDKFPPPPNHNEVDLGVLFSRKGVSPNKL